MDAWSHSSRASCKRKSARSVFCHGLRNACIGCCNWSGSHCGPKSKASHSRTSSVQTKPENSQRADFGRVSTANLLIDDHEIYFMTTASSKQRVPRPFSKSKATETVSDTSWAARTGQHTHRPSKDQKRRCRRRSMWPTSIRWLKINVSCNIWLSCSIFKEIYFLTAPSVDHTIE